MKRFFVKTLDKTLPKYIFEAILIFFYNYKYFQEKGEISKDREVLEAVKEIESSGFYVIPNFYDAEQCRFLVEEINRIFVTYPKFLQIGDDIRMHGSEYYSEAIKEFRDHKFINEVCSAYGKNINAWVQANIVEADLPQNMGSGGGWHRDGYQRELKALLYLTDCFEGQGYFHCIKGSHRPLAKAIQSLKYGLKINSVRHEGYDDDFRRNKKYQKLKAGAGSLILFDTSLLHSGSPIEIDKRFALTLYNLFSPSINENNIDTLLDHYAVCTNSGKLANRSRIKKHILNQCKFS